MPHSPPRKRFQVHLSTAIILMFVAGGLIWANVVPATQTVLRSNSYIRTTMEVVRSEYGWPFTGRAVSKMKDLRNEVINPLPKEILVEEYYRLLYIGKISGAISYPILSLNLLIALLLLVITWFLCERWIAYRASRKGP